MQHANECIQSPASCCANLRLGLDGSFSEKRLGELEVPIAERMPGEAVKRLGGVIEPIAVERFDDQSLGGGEFVFNV